MRNQIDPGMNSSIPLTSPFSKLPMSQNSQESLTDRFLQAHKNDRKRTGYVEMQSASGYKQFPRNKHHAFRLRKKIWILGDKLIKTFYSIKFRTVRFLYVLVCVCGFPRNMESFYLPSLIYVDLFCRICMRYIHEAYTRILDFVQQIKWRIYTNCMS